MGPAFGVVGVLATAMAAFVSGAAIWRATRFSRDPGRQGEEVTRDAFGRLDGILMLANVQFSVSGRSVEIDHLLIGWGTLLVVETKHFTGRLVPGPGDWLLERRGRMRFLEAPSHQAARHARALRTYLRQIGCPWAAWAIRACAVLTGPFQLAPGPLPQDVPVLGLAELRDFILTALAQPAEYVTSTDSEDERRMWAARLRRSSVRRKDGITGPPRPKLS